MKDPNPAVGRIIPVISKYEIGITVAVDVTERQRVAETVILNFTGDGRVRRGRYAGITAVMHVDVSECLSSGCAADQVHIPIAV